MTLEADHAVLRLQDDETRRFAIRSYFGSADGRTQERLFRLDKRVSVDVLRSRAAVLIRDVAADPRARGLRQRRALAARRAALARRRADRHARALRQDRARPLHAEPLRRRRPAPVRAVRLLPRARARERPAARAHAPAAPLRRGDRAARTSATSRRRIDEELARAGGRDGALALAVARIENLDRDRGARRRPEGAPAHLARRRGAARARCATSTWWRGSAPTSSPC